MSVTIIVDSKLKPEAAEAFARGMEQTLQETRSHDGCMTVRGFRNQDDPSHIIVIEEWETREKYMDYVKWRQSTGMMERVASIMREPMRPSFYDKLD